MKKTILKVLVGILLIAFLSIFVFLLVISGFPNVRKYVLNSNITTVGIRMYNRARPWLHIENTKSCVKKFDNFSGDLAANK